MKIRIFSALLSASVMLAMPAISQASGGYGGGYSDSYNEPARKIDHDFEKGKAIFTGRQSGVSKLSYCVNVDGELKPVKRTTMKSYKASDYSTVTSNLFDCNNTDTSVLSALGEDDTYYVVYYLNKRYKLKLKG